MTRNDLALLCRLSAQALSYPQTDFVGQLLEAVGRVRLELWDDPSLPLSSFIDELGQLAQLPLDRLQGEHTRLFVAAYPHLPCPPYESVYVEGRLHGDAAEDVDGLYRRWGLVVDGEEVDHAGAELEFEAFLLALGTPTSLTDASRFLTKHLLVWLPRFAADVVRESRLPFYRSVGRLLIAVLENQMALASTV